MKTKKIMVLSIAFACLLACSACSPQGTGAQDGVDPSDGETPTYDTMDTLALFQSTASVQQDVNGVTFSSPETAYTGEIKGVFYGDVSLKLDFPERPSEWLEGDFRVHITDASDESKTFTVRYKTSNPWKVNDKTYGEVLYAYTHAYVLYDTGNETLIRSSYAYPYLTDKDKWYKSYQQWGDMADCSPTLKNAVQENYRVPGELQFVFEADGLHVKVSCRSLAPRTIAVFDGTDEFVSLESWGLPKMDFEDGYKISFSSSFESKDTLNRSSAVELQSITYYDSKTLSPQTLRLNQKTITVPCFYRE